MTDFAALLRSLTQEGVEFILAGDAAGVVHGLNRLNGRLEVVCRPTALPVRGPDFTLMTSFGSIDLLGEIAGGGTWETLHRQAIPLDVFGIRCLCLSLPQLIAAKRAAGRPKDLEALAELEAIAEERDV